MDLTWDEPTDIGAVVLNLRAECVRCKAIDHDGAVLDLDGFKTALVTTLKKSIVVEDLGQYQRLQREGKLTQPILTKILVYVAWRDGQPDTASLRRTAFAPDARIRAYVAQRQDGQVRLVGEPALDDARQHRLFASLAESVGAAQIFDEESPAVAAALRRALDRR